MTGALVGRGPVLALALAALDQAALGAGQLLVVSGEPGIGKSALLAELAGHASARGTRVLRGGCWDGGGAPAYWPWTQVLRGAAALSPDGLGADDAGPVSRLLATSTEERHDGDPAVARFALLDAVGGVLARLASEAPLLVALDDLHWADDASLQLLDFLVGRLRAEPVLFVGAYRDAEAGPALRTVVAGGQLLPLVGLTASQVRELMAAVAPNPDEGPPEALARRVWRRSGGNPFFARELTRLVLSQGGWGRADAVTAVPDTVRDTLERRLARLSQPCVELLAVAAVAGTEVREEVLARVVRPDAARSDLLAEAARARVLAPPEDVAGRYRFSHDLYRETIEAGLPAATRGALHLAVGRALEALRAEGADVHVAEVAAHLLASGVEDALPEAARLSADAAAEAMARLGYEDACRHYERALAAWDRTGGAPAPRLALLIDLADARYRAGDGEGARSALQGAVQLARRLDDVPGLARAAVALHDLGARGTGREAAMNVSLLTEAAALLPPEPSALRARVLTALVQSMRHQGEATDQDRIVAAAHEAVDVATAVDDPSALAFALLALHDALWQPGSGDQRLAVLDEMQAAATAAGNRELAAQAHQLRAAALLESGQPAGRAELSRYVELMAASGHARGRWEALTRRATIAIVGGRWTEALDLADEAWELGRTLGVPDAIGVYGTLRFSLAIFGGVGGAMAAGGTVDDGAPSPAYVPVLRAGAYLCEGDVEGAARSLAGYVVDDMLDLHDLEPVAILAAVVAPAGSEEQRRRVYDRLRPYSGLHAIVGGCASYWGSVDHHLGLLALALGMNDHAAVHLAAAAEGYEHLGAPAWAAMCRAAAPVGEGPQRAVFRFDGGSWTLRYEGREVHLPDAKGLHDLAVLVGQPGRPVHVLRLLGGEAPGGSDPVLDDRARAAYRARLGDLDADIEEARTRQDPARAERLEDERDALVHELAAAAGLGGRTRRLGDRSERARKTVTARIRDSLRRIDAVHPALADHLRASVTTGTECTYAPAEPVRWQL